ncbi:hypothetical protein IV203_017854 [Nitzschia inconspicua]|uniref:RRM domain-containing protein n=1 Tax=Nitzschia inconspicua TaxID=303405 RepID=A0A9K3Q5D3_9STRA|nr:hypothetical protein IV203_020553 [Nitzschia inconspicua]KAG7371713.1 hypothetical protein IV203_017854 [Nitzschia inconspicua]
MMMSVRNGTAVTVVAVATFLSAASAWRYFSCNPKLKSDKKKTKSTKWSQVRIQTPLRHVTPSPGEASRIVYLTGIDKATTFEELLEIFSQGGSAPIKVDLSEVSFAKGGGRAWAMYETSQEARTVVEIVHQTIFRGCTLCARLELGVEADGRRITDKSVHTAVMRSIQPRRGGGGGGVGTTTTTTKTSTTQNKNKTQTKKIKSNNYNNKNKNNQPPTAVSYSHKSLSVGSIEYPFPSGLYLTKLIQHLSKQSSQSNNTTDCNTQSQQSTGKRNDNTDILDLLSDVSKIGGGSMTQYAKEISEAFAMVDAVERAVSKIQRHLQQRNVHQSTTCYCLGDGKYPLTASALALTMPTDWKFISIDPLLQQQQQQWDDVHSTCFHERIQLFCGLSQDFSIPKKSKQEHGGGGVEDRHTELTVTVPTRLAVVIACHSHAPLEEFWNRLVDNHDGPKICVAMPCCAQFNELTNETPLLEYDNFEVYSPKRHIQIYFRP